MWGCSAQCSPPTDPRPSLPLLQGLTPRQVLHQPIFFQLSDCTFSDSIVQFWGWMSACCHIGRRADSAGQPYLAQGWQPGCKRLRLGQICLGSACNISYLVTTMTKAAMSFGPFRRFRHRSMSKPHNSDFCWQHLLGISIIFMPGYTQQIFDDAERKSTIKAWLCGCLRTRFSHKACSGLDP